MVFYDSTTLIKKTTDADCSSSIQKAVEIQSPLAVGVT